MRTLLGGCSIACSNSWRGVGVYTVMSPNALFLEIFDRVHRRVDLVECSEDALH